MLIDNISEKNFNLESGLCEPGNRSEATFKEGQMLIKQGFAKLAIDNPESDKIPWSDESDLSKLMDECRAKGIAFRSDSKEASLKQKLANYVG